MRAITRIVSGSLLGIALILTGSTQAKADNCLLIVCVDAPIVGPIVGGLGDVLEEVLSPNQPTTPTQPQPPVQPPVKPPVQPPVNPPVNPPAQPPTQPGTTNPSTPMPPTAPQTGTTPPDSESEGNPAPEEQTVVPAPSPGPTTTLTPTPKPSPSSTSRNPPRLLPDDTTDEGNPFHHVGVLTPFIVGVLLMLLIVLSATSFTRYFRSRRPVDVHDQSALPHKKI